MHGTGMFDSPGVFYSNDPKIIFNDEWLLDGAKIKNLKQHNLNVIDLSSEHYGVSGLDYVYCALEEAGINFLLLVHDPADHLKYPRMLFYPHWYHWARKKFITNKNYSNNRTYKWSCLNGKSRPHRIYNYFYSQQQSYFDSAYFTMHNFDAHRDDNIVISDDVVQWWDQIKNNLISNARMMTDVSCDSPANTDAYIHVVTETTVLPKLFLSEKSWKPVATGQMFLIFGNPGSIGYLRDCGVDVFDDIIDHSYDLIPDWQERVHAMHNQLKYLLTQNLNNKYIDTASRRTDNIDKFFNGSFDPQYLQTILQCINTLS
jgi:hypothetical protein